MPYFVHIKGVEPTFGEPFESRAEAHAAAQLREDRALVTFVLTTTDASAWRDREQSRMCYGEYKKAPWNDDATSRALGISYERYEQVIDLFCHLSKKQPGKVAYTPSEEHGYQDRQVTIKPGKYLEMLTDLFSVQEIAEYVAIVKATAETHLKLATSAEDIISVYEHGPSSCMGKANHFGTDTHPVVVYGESDLAVAYLGSLKQASARCVVWPGKKIYTRVYGDDTLRVLLKSEGYEEGTLGGARIRAIADSNYGYILPYIDAADSADLSRDKLWFNLLDDESGEWSTKETDGHTCKREQYSCSECGDSVDEDNSYCDNCNENRYTCYRCDAETFDLSGSDFVEVNDCWYCESCAERWLRTCAVCSDTWYGRDATDICSGCEGSHTWCSDCDKYWNEKEEDDCPDCREPEDEDEDEDTEPATPAEVVSIPFGDGSRHDAVVIASSSHLIVHKPITLSSRDSRKGFVITHRHTGAIVMRVKRESIAREAMRCLVAGADWSFQARHSAPERTLSHCRHVRSQFEAYLC